MRRVVESGLRRSGSDSSWGRGRLLGATAGTGAMRWRGDRRGARRRGVAISNAGVRRWTDVAALQASGVPRIGSPLRERLSRGLEKRSHVGLVCQVEGIEPTDLSTDVFGGGASSGSGNIEGSRGLEKPAHVAGPVGGKVRCDFIHGVGKQYPSRGLEKPAYVEVVCQVEGIEPTDLLTDVFGDGASSGSGNVGESRGSEKPAHVGGPVGGKVRCNCIHGVGKQNPSRGSENPSHVGGPVGGKVRCDFIHGVGKQYPSRGLEKPAYVEVVCQVGGIEPTDLLTDVFGDGASSGSGNVEGSRGLEKPAHVGGPIGGKVRCDFIHGVGEAIPESRFGEACPR